MNLLRFSLYSESFFVFSTSFLFVSTIWSNCSFIESRLLLIENNISIITMHIIVKITIIINTSLQLKWRRVRDSNPRNLSAQRFSRPPHSTTLPTLLKIPQNIRNRTYLQKRNITLMYIKLNMELIL